MSPSAPLDRREFLRRGLQVGALTAGALGAAASLAGCGSAGSPAPSTSTSTVPPRPPREADWRRLEASLTGRLLRPSSAAYATSRLLYNSKFADPRPAAIALCASGDDVARCVDFVSTHVLEVTARSGGHSYGGYSSCAGLVIDVSGLHAISVDTRRNTAAVGSGARMIDVYDTLGRSNRLLPGGSCPSVGVAGLTLGGGMGVFGRKFGLTCDNLRAVRMVTGAGDRVAADASEHSDLWWACRGGGGGNFGVATSFEFDVHPIPDITLFSLRYPWAAATDVLEGWQHWMSAVPDELWSSLHLFSQGTYGYSVQVSGVYCGPASALDTHLASFRSTVGAAASDVFVGADDYLEAMKIEAGCSSLSIAACHLPTDNRHGVLSREAYAAKSSFLDGPTTSVHAARLVGAVESLQGRAPTLGGGLSFDACGGAISRVDASASAFVHRDALACIQAAYSWSHYSAKAEIAAGQQWLTWLGAELLDPSAGAYLNYIDPTLADWPSAYYGSNLDRLVRIKGRYDPSNRFAFAQSIPLRL